MERQVTLDMVFDEVNQDGEWRKLLAKQLNILLGRARYFKETSNDESDKEAEQATLAVVERVSAFEEVAKAGDGATRKLLEVRVFAPLDTPDSKLNEIGEQMQLGLPANFSAEGIEVEDVTFEVRAN